MSANPQAHPGHSPLRTVVSVLGPPLMAGASSAALTAFLPVSASARAGIGGQAMIPLWVLFACILPLQRSGRRALAWCALVCLPLVAALTWRAL